ncbi:putative secreted protein [Candidatus Phytoplasma luffae]|uniref:Secreted protein n=1 Tax=Loofah witches'-broom phytoplasma TaxID=35773 RepID=A0A975FJ94_LOWBP|nr:hypothetical protein [Candidatus Phytoplasma luffae]QTX02921.1 putative secreted protein [Candidatus Phytoplasma luffae]QTX02980.1 putative secreted protein [Candidatus Phytoplasma luffae]
MHFNKKKISIYLCIFLFIIFFLIFIAKEISPINICCNHNNKEEEKEDTPYLKGDSFINEYNKNLKQNLSKINSFDFIKKLAVLGLKNFIKGWKKTQIESYCNIFIADPELFMVEVLKGKLKTASTPLIYGTIDFISEQIKKNISLTIHRIKDSSKNDLSVKTRENLLPSKIDQIVMIEFFNKDDIHFFIKDYNDTQGDGYCFFHALDESLKQQIPKWRDKIILDDVTSVLN